MKKKQRKPASPAKKAARDVRKAIPVKPVRTADELGAYRQGPARVGAADAGLGIALAAAGDAPRLTAEQVALREASDYVRRFLERREEAGRLVGAMVAFRQAYAVAYRELQGLFAAEKEPPHPLAEDLVVGAAMYEASKPFSEHTLMRGVVETVLPWLADVVDRHAAADAEEEVESRLAADLERRRRAVPLGFKHSPEQEGDGLGRDRALVLVGWRNAVLYVLDRMTSAALGAGGGRAHTVVRFMESPPEAGDQHRRLIRLGASAWKGCANTGKALARAMGEHVADKLSYQPDLLVFDNLAACYTAGFIGRPDGANAGDAHKAVFRWCKEAGCAMVGAVPVADRGEVDVRQPEFEQLRTFTYLRPVGVVEEGDAYHIKVGHCVAYTDVPRDVLDRYAPSGLITPEGAIQ